MHNLSLVIFTLLIQTSVGIFGTTIFNIWINNNGMVQIPLIILSTCLGLITLALISAMAHLGNPRKAPHAILNITHSWLSREIVSINLFAISIALLWILTFIGFQKGAFVFQITSLILGILTISTMSRVYYLKAVPVWNNIATSMDFFGTALLAGGVASAVLNLFISDKAFASCLTFLIFSCLGLCFKIFAISSTISVQKRSKNLFWYASLRAKINGHTLTYALRAGLYIIGVVLFAVANMGMMDQPLFFLLTSSAVICLTEIWNRFCFYDSFCRLGL